MTSFVRVLLAAVAVTLLTAACDELPFPTATPEAPDDGLTLSIMVAPVPADIPAYDRGEWRHWIDEDRDCQDTRQEALIEESTSPVEYKDADECRVASGEWNGPYTGEQFTDPSDLDVDHMVPLGNAHRSGGWLWSESRRRDYANDLSYAGHLIAVQNSANRAKGADGPEEWKPPDRGYWCQYATDWITIKNTWRLTATSSEAAALSEMLNTCTPQITLTTVEAERPQPGPLPTVSDTTSPQPIATSTTTPASTPLPVGTAEATPASGDVYGSCEEAEAAGETRVLGSAGDGWGFPKAKVPSVRDGDSDGVVCEESGPSAATPVATDEVVKATPTPTPAPLPTDTPLPTSAPEAVYDSCDAAEDAGEERVLGSSGNGRGFPQEMVPSARDGDGDGVVCET